MRAALASLLDLPINEVPHFLREEKNSAYDFWEGVTDFCLAQGYVFMMLPAVNFKWASDAVYHAISGPSPRGNGIYHTVVGCNGKIVHDPHPSKSGLSGDPSEWTFEFLVRAAPSAGNGEAKGDGNG